MPEAHRLKAGVHDAAFGCEDEARETLASAATALSAVPGSPLASGRATLSLRWKRSGAEGLLAAFVLPGQPAQDADAVRWLSLAEELGGSRSDTDVGMNADADVDIDMEMDTDVDTDAMRLHRALYRHRADVSAVLSARPVFSTTLACLPRLQAEGISEFHPDVSAAVGGTIRCASQAPRLPRSPARADPVLDALRDRHACLLAGRGLLTIGPALSVVLARAAEIESLAQIYWQVLQLDGRAAGPSTGARSAGPADDAMATAAEERGR
jgi:ribulose-5-phosphate 4-epimerase/fuculose-1-phosphate aldolase